jgi:chromosome segregation ATPase
LLESELEKLKAQMHTLEQRCDSLSSTINGCKQRVQSTNTALERRENRIACLEQRLSSTSDSTSDAEAVNMSTVSSDSADNACVSAHMHAAQQTQDELSKERKRRSEVESQMHELQTQGQSQEQLIAFLRNELNGRDQRLEQLRSLIRQQREEDNRQTEHLRNE